VKTLNRKPALGVFQYLRPRRPEA